MHGSVPGIGTGQTALLGTELATDSGELIPILPLRTIGGMRFLQYLAAAFINTFGITQPAEATRRRAAWFIFLMILLTLALVSAIGFLFYAAMQH